MRNLGESMKKTWKFGSKAGEAGDVMRSAPSLAAAAKVLQVDKSTVFRWVKERRIPPPGGRQLLRPRVVGLPSVPADPGDWGASVRSSYVLTPTDVVLVELAEAALTIARDPTQSVMARLTAAGRFQLLVKQLRLEDPQDGAIEDRERRHVG